MSNQKNGKFEAIVFACQLQSQCSKYTCARVLCRNNACSNQPPQTAQAQCGQVTTDLTASKRQTDHSLLEPEGVAHFLPVLPHDDMLEALKKGRGDSIVPQPVELVPGGGVRCPQTQPISKLHLVEGVCQQLLALHASVQVDMEALEW